MNLKQLETFFWVATLNSFRKTADRLCTTQPAVSSRIAALEQSLSVKLFERRAGTFSLTAKGQELMPYATNMLLMADRLKEKAYETASLSGALRLGVSETIVHTWLPDFLNRVHLLYPNIDIELTVDVSANMRNELVNRKLDIAFLMGPISEYSIINVDLCAFELVWACCPKIDFPEGSVPLEQILKQPIITYARNTRPFAEIQNLFREEVLEPVRIFPSTSLAACKRMSMDGIGVGTLPITYIRNEVDEGLLKILPSTWKPSNLEFTASYPREPFNRMAERIATLAQETAKDVDK